MKIGRTTYGGDRPICTAQPIMVTGGFNLDQSANAFTEGDVIPAGSLCVIDEATRKVKVLKVGKVKAINAGDAKIVTLEADQYMKPVFKAGDSVLTTVSGAFASAPTISSIDKTGGGFVVTMSAEISGLQVGDILQQVIASGTSAALIASSFQAMVIADAEVKASDVETGIDVTLDSGHGAFYANRIPPIPSAFLNGNVLKDNPNIKITNSY